MSWLLTSTISALISRGSGAQSSIFHRILAANTFALLSAGHSVLIALTVVLNTMRFLASAAFQVLGTLARTCTNFGLKRVRIAILGILDSFLAFILELRLVHAHSAIALLSAIMPSCKALAI